MKKLSLILFLLMGLLFTNELSAQNYSSAIGARLGVPISVSYKMFISERTAIEAFGSYQSNRSNLAGLTTAVGWSSFGVGAAYLLHTDFNNTEGLTWYYGGGASINFFTYSDGYAGNNAGTSIALSGYLGLDYKFGNAPVNISLDWVPTFYIGNAGLGGFGAGFGALAVRYVLSE